MEMHNNPAINEATMDYKKYLPRPWSFLWTYAISIIPWSFLSTYAISIINRRVSHKGEGSTTRQKVPETDESIVKNRRSLLLMLPAEIRNKIYLMVLDTIPSRIVKPWYHRSPCGGCCLVQPALAKVNRQLRTEILPMFYYRKGSFFMRVYSKKHLEDDEVWNSFLDHLAALTGRRDGASFLSYIQSLDVEVWPMPIRWHHSYHTNADDNVFNMPAYNGIALRFGRSQGHHWHRAGGDDTDWTDRDAAATALLAGIRESYRGRRYTPAPVSFKEMYPLDRLVDLAMMIASGCNDGAQVILVATYFAPQSWVHVTGVGL